MEIVVNGWRRDHGAKFVAHGELSKAVNEEDDESAHYHVGTTYIRKVRPRLHLNTSEVQPAQRDSDQPRVRIMMAADLNLSGTYGVQCYLTKADIAKLFQMTHADDSLDEVVIKLAELRDGRK